PIADCASRIVAKGNIQWSEADGRQTGETGIRFCGPNSRQRIDISISITCDDHDIAEAAGGYWAEGQHQVRRTQPRQIKGRWGYDSERAAINRGHGIDNPFRSAVCDNKTGLSDLAYICIDCAKIQRRG